MYITVLLKPLIIALKPFAAETMFELLLFTVANVPLFSYVVVLPIGLEDAPNPIESPLGNLIPSNEFIVGTDVEDVLFHAKEKCPLVELLWNALNKIILVFNGTKVKTEFVKAVTPLSVI